VFHVTGGGYQAGADAVRGEEIRPRHFRHFAATVPACRKAAFRRKDLFVDGAGIDFPRIPTESGHKMMAKLGHRMRQCYSSRTVFCNKCCPSRKSKAAIRKSRDADLPAAMKLSN
jgi:hypothetical protein